MEIEVPYGMAVILAWLGFLVPVALVIYLYLSIKRSWRDTDVFAEETLIRKGYTNVGKLTKDAQGRWAGSATKDGKTVAVAVDTKGSVTTA